VVVVRAQGGRGGEHGEDEQGSGGAHEAMLRAAIKQTVKNRLKGG
jgi:hypothetical protein